MFPAVESAEQLDAARRAIYMPPRGMRRPGGWGNYWMADYQYETWLKDYEEHLIVLTQIESTRGLENVEAIARHELVTAMAIGPYDLSASIGCCWDPDDPRLTDALKRIRQAGRAAGKNTWYGMGGKPLVDEGWTFLCLGTPSFLLETIMREMTEEACGGRDAAQAPPIA